MILLYADYGNCSDVIGVLHSEEMLDACYDQLEAYCATFRGELIPSCDPAYAECVDFVNEGFRGELKKSWGLKLPADKQTELDAWLAACPIAESATVDNIYMENGAYVVQTTIKVAKGA